MYCGVLYYVINLFAIFPLLQCVIQLPSFLTLPINNITSLEAQVSSTFSRISRIGILSVIRDFDIRVLRVSLNMVR